jgi:hypothetical protein
MTNLNVLKELLSDLYEYTKEKLQFDELAEIRLLENEKNSENPLADTAYYDPEKQLIVIYISGRHIKDVLRSFAHEIIHHEQICSGQLEKSDFEKLASKQYAQEDEKLRKLEKDAYERGNILFRDWEAKRKEVLNEQKTNLLLEGGVAGHMNHLYDNLELTFSEMKEIFKNAASGKLKGTEKTDGQNIFLSYSVKRGEVVAARNKGNIKSGGMTAKELAQKFEGRGSLETVFNDAFNAWERMVRSLPKGVQIKIFGPDANIYYNAEIQDSRNSNVIRYDTKNLVVHQEGHAEFDKETGEVTGKDVKENWKVLNSVLEKNVLKKHDYNVLSNAVTTLQALSDKQPLEKALSNLQTVLKNEEIGDNQTIEDYILVRIRKTLNGSSVQLPETTREEIIKRILGYKGVTVNTIFKTLPKSEDLKAQKEKVKVFVKNAQEILKNAINPIETIVHDFSVEMLKGLQSAFVLDQNKEVERLRKELATVIKEIEASKDPEQIAFLQKQFKKIKNIENISTASEGFVFDYGGKVYKFTGNFAPMNQILGLFKYSRKTKLQEDRTPKKIAILPGGFKPPHEGHYLAAKFLQEKTDASEVLVMISPKERKAEFDGKSVIIDAKKSLEIWNIYLKNEHNIWADIAPSVSPVKSTYDYLEKLSPGSILYVGVSEKDVDDKRFDGLQKWSDDKNLGVKAEKVVIPIESYISGTEMRQIILSKKYNIFAKYLPKHLSKKEKTAIWGIVNKQEIEEISAMAGGAVEGGMGMKKKKRETLIREMNDFLLTERGKFYMEIKEEKAFRSLIEKMIKAKIAKIQKEKLEENRFRELVAKMILKEAKAVTTSPHFSTGINILKNLLKKIIPIVEIDYKQLTTNKYQRDSFRSHIVNGIQKTLERENSPDQDEELKVSGKISGDSDAEVGLQEQDLEDKSVNFDIGEPGAEPVKKEVDQDKFIDINAGEQEEKSKEEETQTTDEKEFGISGQDETGRNLAYQTYQKIEKEIIRAYTVLSSVDDRNVFEEYLVTNVKMYFDKFEEELSTMVKEPTTSEYEKRKEEIK